MVFHSEIYVASYKNPMDESGEITFDKNGNLLQKRYYDKDGRVTKDVDYSHGDSHNKLHSLMNMTGLGK